MSIKMVTELISLHMHLTCQEREQVDVIFMNISGEELFCCLIEQSFEGNICQSFNFENLLE